MSLIREEYEFDCDQFMTDIREAAGETTLRRIADMVGDVSAATFSRLDNNNPPDMRTFLIICSRLKLEPAHYFRLVRWQRVEAS